MRRTYESYKASGVEWIGDVPAGWEVVKIKHCVRITNGSDPTTEGDIPVYGSGSTSFKTCGEYKEGPTVLLGRKGTINIPRYVEGKYWNVDTAFDVKSKGKFDLKLFYYMATCFDYDSYVTKTAVPSMTQSDYNNMFIPLPPLPEQRQIAAWLDRRVGQLDGYAAALEREAALVRELKQAEVARAVTRGLDGAAPLKPSGVEWIGDVPAGWEVDYLGHHFRERRTKVSDTEYPPLSVSKMGVTPQLETACKTDNGDNRKLVCKGDFVVNSRSDRKGSCGLSDYDGSVSLINTVLTPIDMDGKYCHYLFRTNDYVEEFYRIGRGIVADLWTTRYDEMRNLKIPLPPLPEQRQIAAWLDRRVGQLDRLAATLEREAALVRELKSREIADAVTGKVRVSV